MGIRVYSIFKDIRNSCRKAHTLNLRDLYAISQDEFKGLETIVQEDRILDGLIHHEDVDDPAEEEL